LARDSFFELSEMSAQMVENPLPEMMRLSLSDLALRIKIMKIKIGTSIEDVLSRALDPPAAINIQRAISVLVEVRDITFISQKHVP
jgi:ATP-dependent RNA helicase DHX29